MKRFIIIALAVCFAMYGVSPCLAGEKSQAPAAAKTSKPSAKPVQKDEDTGVISGKVAETMNSGGYTYVLLEKEGKKTWVAVQEMKIAKGETAAFKPGTVMTNFESKTLKRTFDKIVFSDGPVTQHPSAKEIASMDSKKSEPATSKKISVEKASGENAYTVSEVYSKKATLNNKKVVVRGEVVKVSQGIMQKNWIHIQDGTGDAKKGTNNLVVTTQDTAAVGETVTVSGTMYKDKDFGSGYKYAVIVEKATVKK